MQFTTVRLKAESVATVTLNVQKMNAYNSIMLNGWYLFNDVALDDDIRRDHHRGVVPSRRRMFKTSKRC